MDRNNCSALETLAIHYYRMAEDRYQTEMKGYEKQNESSVQAVTQCIGRDQCQFSNFTRLFRKIVQVESRPRFANYLGNIYTVSRTRSRPIITIAKQGN